MESKEILISSGVLIIILVGIILLVKGTSKLPEENLLKKEENTLQQQIEGVKTTQDLQSSDTEILDNSGDLDSEGLDNSGFEARNQLNQEQAQKQAESQAQQQAQQNQQNPQNMIDPSKLPLKQVPITGQQPAKKLPPPKMMLEEGVDYRARFVTSMGTFEIDLFEDKTPITVNNFIYLAKNDFYDNTIFHRVIQDFMIQGGDPTGTGASGPGYSFEDEITKEPLVRGSLAMANSGKDTNGSQFFIVTKQSTPWLNKVHTNFGFVINNMDAVMKIQRQKTDANDRPLKDIIIKDVEIYEN